MNKHELNLLVVQMAARKFRGLYGHRLQDLQSWVSLDVERLLDQLSTPVTYALMGQSLEDLCNLIQLLEGQHLELDISPAHASRGLEPLLTNLAHLYLAAEVTDAVRQLYFDVTADTGFAEEAKEGYLQAAGWYAAGRLKGFEHSIEEWLGLFLSSARMIHSGVPRTTAVLVEGNKVFDIIGGANAAGRYFYEAQHGHAAMTYVAEKDALLEAARIWKAT